jgi:hypothetical protein
MVYYLIKILTEKLNGNEDLVKKIINTVFDNDIFYHYSKHGLNNHKLIGISFRKLKQHNLTMYNDIVHKYKLKNKWAICNCLSYKEHLRSDHRGFDLMYDRKNIPNKDIINLMKKYLYHPVLFREKIIDYTRYGSNRLKYNKMWCIKVKLKALTMPGFIYIRNTENTELKNPSIKYMINSLEFIEKKHGIMYVNLITYEFENGGAPYGIILTHDGIIENILGGYILHHGL